MQRLRTPIDPAVFVAGAVADRVAPQRAEELLAVLTQAGLLGPREVVRTVVVLGDGPLGAAVARGLLEVGVRRLHLAPDESAGVTGRDATEADDGEILTRLRAAHPHAEITAGPDAPDAALVVITGLAVVASRLAARFLSADVPHLPLVLSGDGICVGPVLRPGRDACVHCMQLHRVDADPDWALRCLESGQALPPAPLLACAVAHTVAQAVAHLDGSPSDRQSLRLRLPDGSPDLIAWEPHPRCGCLDQWSVRALA